MWSIRRAAWTCLVSASLGSPVAAAAQMVVRLPPHDSVLVTILPATSHPCPEEACAVALQPFASAPDTLLPQRTAVALWRLWRPRLDSTSVRLLVIATLTTPRASTSGSAVEYGDGHFVFVRVADGHWRLLERRYATEAYHLVVDSLPP